MIEQQLSKRSAISVTVSEEALSEDNNEDEDASKKDEQAIGATNNKGDI